MHGPRIWPIVAALLALTNFLMGADILKARQRAKEAEQRVQNAQFYLTTAILPYWIIRRPPMETRLPNVGSDSQPVVWFGIIDVVWLTAMAGTCGLILGGQQLGVVGGPLPEAGRSAEYYHAALEESYFFLGFTTNGLFATAAALGGCMAILWAGEPWRKVGNVDSRSQYRAHTLASAKMVMAFFVIGLAAVAWASIPLYSRIVQIRELMPSLR